MASRNSGLKLIALLEVDNPALRRSVCEHLFAGEEGMHDLAIARIGLDQLASELCINNKSGVPSNLS